MFQDGTNVNRNGGSGKIFLSGTTTGIVVRNVIFGPVHTDSNVAMDANVTSCSLTIAYSTFTNEGTGLGLCGSVTEIHNLGPNAAGVPTSGILSAGNAAIDAAAATCAADTGGVDFEGDTRPQGSACDRARTSTRREPTLQRQHRHHEIRAAIVGAEHERVADAADGDQSARRRQHVPVVHGVRPGSGGQACGIIRAPDGALGEIKFVNATGLVGATTNIALSDADSWVIIAATRDGAGAGTLSKIPIGGSRTTTAMDTLADSLAWDTDLDIGGDEDAANFLWAAGAYWEGVALTTGQLDGIA